MRGTERRPRTRTYRSKPHVPHVPHVPLDGDERARFDRLSRLTVTVRRLDARCADLVTQIDAALRYRNSTPARFEGWRLEVVIPLLVAAFLAESFTVASLADSLGFRGVERAVLSLIVGGCLIGTGFLIGEMLHRRRIARENDVLSRFAITAACVVALTLLVVAWAPHFGNAGHATQSQTADPKFLTLGILAVALLLLPVAASYHREASAMGRARRRVASLQSRLRAHERLSDRKCDERTNLFIKFNALRAERSVAAASPRNGNGARSSSNGGRR